MSRVPSLYISPGALAGSGGIPSLAAAVRGADGSVYPPPVARLRPRPGGLPLDAPQHQHADGSVADQDPAHQHDTPRRDIPNIPNQEQQLPGPRRYSR